MAGTTWSSSGEQPPRNGGEGPPPTPTTSLASPSEAMSSPGGHRDAWVLGRSLEVLPLMVSAIPGGSPLPTVGLHFPWESPQPPEGPMAPKGSVLPSGVPAAPGCPQCSHVPLASRDPHCSLRVTKPHSRDRMEPGCAPSSLSGGSHTPTWGPHLTLGCPSGSESPIFVLHSQ